MLFIVKSVHDKAIVGGIQNNCANCYDLDASADGLKRVSSHHRYTFMSDLRKDNTGTIACIIYDGPFDDRSVKYSTDYGEVMAHTRSWSQSNRSMVHIAGQNVLSEQPQNVYDKIMSYFAIVGIR